MIQRTFSALLGLSLVACGSDPTGSEPSALAALRSAQTPARFSSQPGSPLVDRAFLADPHDGGVATSFTLADVRYGRSVELWSERPDGSMKRVATDFVIGPDHVGDGIQSRLVVQPVLGTERLIIAADVDDRSNTGRRRFLATAGAAAATTQAVVDAGLAATGLVTEVPRNAALELRFNDLVDADAVAAALPQVFVGSPTIVPFGARVIESTMFGGRARSDGAFAPTRVVIDLAPRASEMERSRAVVASNPQGLPAPSDSAANVGLRIATAGGPTLRNLAGHAVTPGAGTVDLGSATRDIVRVFRSGSPTSAFAGNLPDADPPRLVARADVRVVDPPQQSLIFGDEFLLPRVRFDSVGCAGAPQVGDVIRQTDLIAEVIADGQPASSGIVTGVHVRLLAFPSAWSGPGQWSTDGVGPARYDAPYDTSMDDLRVACLVSVDPPALGAPSAPTRGIPADASFSFAFNEPIAPESIDDLEASMLGRAPLAAFGSLVPGDIVVGSLQLGADGESLRLTPLLPLANPQGTAVPYWLTPRLGVGAARDLAGNGLVDSPGPIAMSLDPASSAADTDSLLWQLDRMDHGGATGLEWDGQITYDLAEERIRPRPVVRTQAVIDASQPIIANMTAFPQGVQTPLNPLGARAQLLWRYVDMGLDLVDRATTNVDVEGLAWAPRGGAVVQDTFAEFEIRLGHSRWAPDEVIDPSSLFPRFQNSGSGQNFANNELSGGGAQGTVVHPRSLGYNLNPGDAFQVASGTVLMPFPLNRIPGEPLRTYTWRDTETRSRAGSNSGGVEPQQAFVVAGTQEPNVPYYRNGQVQTLGLPLLMDFSTWPDATANGTNALLISLAANSSSRPYFRAFSAGGVTQAGVIVQVDPAAEAMANGGFNPASNPPGQASFGLDNAVQLGAVDFVVRKSVAHSIWVDAGTDSGQRRFLDPIVGPSVQPAGTSVRVDVRYSGSISLVSSGPTPNDQDASGAPDFFEDAAQLDLYGDFYPDLTGMFINHDSSRSNPGIVFPAGSGAADDWRSSVAGVQGARYLQLRLVMENDPVSGAMPSVSAVGLAWQN